MVKEIKKETDNIISKKEFGGSLGLKFRRLCLKIKKRTQALGQEKRLNSLKLVFRSI